MDNFKIIDEIEIKTIKRREDKMGNTIKLSGEMLFELRKNGKVIERELVKNLIVNVGKEQIARLLGNEVVDGFTYIAIGTGTNAENVTDSALQTEVTRALATKVYEADYKYKFEKTFTFGSAESYAITEACLSDSSGASGEVILNRKVFSAKNVDSDTDLYVKITITVS